MTLKIWIQSEQFNFAIEKLLRCRVCSIQCEAIWLRGTNLSFGARQFAVRAAPWFPVASRTTEKRPNPIIPLFSWDTEKPRNKPASLTSPFYFPERLINLKNGSWSECRRTDLEKYKAFRPGMTQIDFVFFFSE